MPSETLSQVETSHPSEPTLTENLALAAQQTARLEAELKTLASTDTYPEWWMKKSVSLGKIKDQLKTPGTDPKYISEYFQLYRKQKEVRAVISNDDPGVSLITLVNYDLGVETVAKGFASEEPDGPIHTAILEGLTDTGTKYISVESELNLLRHAYNMATVTDLLGVRGDQYSDTLKPLLRSEHAIKAMRHTDQERSETWPDTKAKTSKWMAHALSSATGINETEATEYVFLASRRGENKSIATILDRFDHFGVERLRALADFTGNYAFETCSVDQLNLMESLMQNPQETARRLSGHDVIAMMINFVGDDRSVLANAAENVEDGNQRTLPFGIKGMGDIYRHMLKLHKLGIHPSTLMLVSHSAPGQFAVSDVREPGMKRRDIATIAGRTLVEFVNKNDKLDPGDYAYAMHGMKGMARLVEDLMQPSRAIDDAEEDAGRKKIIFQACDAASDTKSVDIGQNNEKFSMGLDSIVNRLGNDLLNNGVHSNVDIYGAPAGIQLHKSEQGLRYSGQPASIGEERQPQHAVRIRIEGGKLTRQEIDEIVMRKATA